MTRIGNRFFTHLRVAQRVLCLLLVIAAPAALRGQTYFYGGREILNTSHSGHHVHAQGDTVAIAALRSASNTKFDPAGLLYQLRPDGIGWDSIPIPAERYWPKNAPGSNAMAGYGWHADSVARDTFYGVWVARSIHDVRYTPVGRPGGQLPKETLYNIVPHHYNPSVVMLQTYQRDREYQTAFITTDGGVTWKKFMPQIRASDIQRLYYYGFDPHFPNRIYIGIDITNPDIWYPGIIDFRAVYTDDFGETYIDTSFVVDGRSEPMNASWERGFGIWSGVGGVTFDPLITDFRLTSDSLLLQPGQAPTRIRLPWLENARRSLAPNFDSTTDTFVHQQAMQLGFHSKHPNLLVLGFYHRYTVGGVTDSVSIMAMSNDFGQTWRALALVPVHQDTAPEGSRRPLDVAIDPTGPHVYVCYRHARTILPNVNTRYNAYTVAWRNVPLGVGGAPETSQPNEHGLVVWPAPVRSGTTLHVRSTTPFPAHLAAAHIYNSAGILVAALPLHGTGDTTIEVRLPQLTAGLYVIALATDTLPSKHLGSSLFIVSE